MEAAQPLKPESAGKEQKFLGAFIETKVWPKALPLLRDRPELDYKIEFAKLSLDCELVY